MPMITDTAELRAFCGRMAGERFVTVDTEFMRDRTFWAKLCLVQVAGTTEARAVDPLAPGIDLAPLLELMANRNVLKVMHAARQDLEIFWRLMQGDMPRPVFDTQIAAMVCGFGDQVGYAIGRWFGTKIYAWKEIRLGPLPVFEPRSQSYRGPSERQLSFLSESARQDLDHYRAIFAARAPERSQVLERGWTNELGLERAFVAAGGMLQAGPDPTGAGNVIPGFGNHRAAVPW